MTVEPDAIVISQCDINASTEFLDKGNKIFWMFIKEPRVGLSMNNALMRAISDIYLLSDDMVYVEYYLKL